MAQEITQVETEKPALGNLTISFKHPTPVWAVMIFRVEFFLNKAMLIYLGGTNAVSPDNVKEWIIVLAAIDFFVWGIGRSLGIKPPEEEHRNFYNAKKR